MPFAISANRLALSASALAAASAGLSTTSSCIFSRFARTSGLLSAADVELLLTGVEAERFHARPLAIEALIETAQGLANVEAIAALRGRLRALVFAPAISRST